MGLIAKKNKALKQVSENGDVVYALRVSTYNQESCEEEKRLAEQYGMPYKEEDNEEENSIK